jgi:hypothetical protein
MKAAARFPGAGARWAAGLLAAVMSVAQGQDTHNALKSYTSAVWRWTVAYPAAWTVEAKEADVVRIRSREEGALCSIHSGPMDRFNNVDELTDFLLAHDARFLAGQGRRLAIVARRRIALPNGVSGNDVLADIVPGGRSRRVHVLADGRGFALDCEAYSRDWKRLAASYQRILASFTVAR